MIYDIFNCNWVVTRWQQYSTHIHTNNTENDTKQTIHRTTQKLGRVRAVPCLCGFYPGICLTTEEKAWKILSQGSHTLTYNENTTYCFSTATMVARMRLSVMLYVHWLALLFSFQKNPAVCSVLCIPAQILVINTADVTGKLFFWVIHKRYVEWVLTRVLFYSPKVTHISYKILCF